MTETASDTLMHERIDHAYNYAVHAATEASKARRDARRATLLSLALLCAVLLLTLHRGL